MSHEARLAELNIVLPDPPKVQIFGPAGLAARSAIGAPSLPAGIPVEIEAIFEVAGLSRRGRPPPAHRL
ncbi:MAG TPA: hypothetical protein VFS43_42385 [Polyangiaceae bacterium]|nr:hypothetical protein [Polyangiaceae bacterium]